MSPWHIVFGFHGALDRLPFVGGLAGVLALFVAGIRGSEMLLPWMAEVLAPRGINAGFALNAIWSVLALLLVWALTALLAKRLRAVGRSWWWAPVAVAPLVVLALINDAIFLVSRSFALPGWLNGLLLAAAVGVALWVLVECLRNHSEPTPTAKRAS
jgi:uncharacterized membrane protein YhaH (DUF805 family)